MIAKLLSFARSIRNDANITDVKIDPGGGANITAEHFSAPGDDSFPLKTDYVLATDTPRSGGKAAAGYLDPINTPVAQEGEKRIYGRDPANGTPVNQVWLKADGSVLVSNDNGSVLLHPDGGSVTTTPLSTFNVDADGSIKGDNSIGSFELELGGNFVVNGVTIDTSGGITTPSAIIAGTTIVSPAAFIGGKQLAGHKHSQGNDSNGDTQVNTSGNI